MQDGYAVVAADGPGEYPVIAAARAGDDCSQLHLGSGTVVYITTGGGTLASLLFLFLRISYSKEFIKSFKRVYIPYDKQESLTRMPMIRKNTFELEPLCLDSLLEVQVACFACVGVLENGTKNPV